MSSSSEPPRRPSPDDEPADRFRATTPEAADGPVRPDGPTVVLPSGSSAEDTGAASPPGGPAGADGPEAGYPEADAQARDLGRPDGPTVVLTSDFLRTAVPQPPPARPDEPTHPADEPVHTADHPVPTADSPPSA
ncbi:hypothetical protein AB0J52_07260, partial [Spirillospora sp. NPDC049652]